MFKTALSSYQSNSKKLQTLKEENDNLKNDLIEQRRWFEEKLQEKNREIVDIKNRLDKLENNQENKQTKRRERAYSLTNSNHSATLFGGILTTE